MASLSQWLCGQSLLISPSTGHGVLRTTKHRNYNTKLNGQLVVPPIRIQRTVRPLCPVSWWQEDGSATPKPSKQKWQFFWCTRDKSSDRTASTTNSENLSQGSSKDDTASPHFILQQIQKLRKDMQQLNVDRTMEYGVANTSLRLKILDNKFDDEITEFDGDRYIHPPLLTAIFAYIDVDLSHAILGFSKGDETWAVPWTRETIFQVMFLWYSAFWLVGFWIIPILAYAAGFNKESLSYRGQALYSLVTDLAEGTVGMTILYRCLIRVHPLPYKWFYISWKGNWLINACLGCLMFPLVHMLQRVNLHLLPVSPPITTSHILEQSILARDPIAMLLYATVVSICAPIWEEVIFRGFLLPSLTRYMSIGSSIVVSAIAFAIAHFSVQRFLPLTFLGLIMGIVFVRSRNLLASVLVHSLWNGFVFLELFM